MTSEWREIIKKLEFQMDLGRKIYGILKETRTAEIGIAVLPLCDFDINNDLCLAIEKYKDEYNYEKIILVIDELSAWKQFFSESCYEIVGLSSDEFIALHIFIAESGLWFEPTIRGFYGKESIVIRNGSYSLISEETQ